MDRRPCRGRGQAETSNRTDCRGCLRILVDDATPMTPKSRSGLEIACTCKICRQPLDGDLHHTPAPYKWGTTRNVDRRGNVAALENAETLSAAYMRESKLVRP